MTRVWMSILMAIALLGCDTQASPAQRPGASAKSERPAAAVSGKAPQVVKAIRIPAGVKFNEKLDASGKLQGLTIVARDNSVQTLACGCSGACAPSGSNPCKATKQEPTGSTIYQCSGSCVGSEQGPCGQCSMQPSGDILTPHDFKRVLGVEVVGNARPAVQRDPEPKKP